MGGANPYQLQHQFRLIDFPFFPGAFGFPTYVSFLDVFPLSLGTFWEFLHFSFRFFFPCPYVIVFLVLPPFFLSCSVFYLVRREKADVVYPPFLFSVVEPRWNFFDLLRAPLVLFSSLVFFFQTRSFTFFCLSGAVWFGTALQGKFGFFNLLFFFRRFLSNDDPLRIFHFCWDFFSPLPAKETSCLLPSIIAFLGGFDLLSFCLLAF